VKVGLKLEKYYLDHFKYKLKLQLKRNIGCKRTSTNTETTHLLQTPPWQYFIYAFFT